jgi:hypothetical protein
MVDLRGGLGYHVLICHPVQGKARSADLKVVVCACKPVVSLPVKECLSACAILLVGVTVLTGKTPDSAVMTTRAGM